MHQLTVKGTNAITHQLKAELPDSVGDQPSDQDDHENKAKLRVDVGTQRSQDQSDT